MVTINDPIYHQAPVGRDFPVHVDLIERVEVIRGPGSSLYGTNAFFGVVNVITRSGERVGGLEVSASAASLSSYGGRIGFGKRWQTGLDLSVSAAAYDSAGERSVYAKAYDSPATNGGMAVDADHERALSAHARLSYGDLTLSGVFGTRDKTIPTAPFETVYNDPRSRTTDTTAYVDAKYQRRFAGDLSVTARLYWDRYAYDGYYALDQTDTGLPGRVAVNRDTGLGHRWGLDVQAMRPFLEHNRVTLGAEVRQDLRIDQRNFYEDPAVLAVAPSPALDDRRRAWVAAAYLQDELRVADWLILNAGVRYDLYDSFGGEMSPRGAVIVRPAAKTFFKALFGHSFRAPSPYELYYQDGLVSQKPNPDLKPEHIQIAELVWEQYVGDHLRSSLAAFSYWADQLIDQQIDPKDGLAQYRNVRRVKSDGAEIELEARSGGGLRGKLSYTYTRTHDRDDDAQISNSPHHLAKLNVIVPLLGDRVFAGAEGWFMSSRQTLQQASTSPAAQVNLTLHAARLVGGLDISAGVYNLFDDRKGDPGGAEHRQDIIAGVGRILRAKATYRW